MRYFKVWIKISVLIVLPLIFSCYIVISGKSNSLTSSDYIEDWDLTWKHPQRDDNKGKDIAIDSSGNVIVVGKSGSDVLLLKFNSSGKLLWYKTWESGVANAMALDSSDNIYITGNQGNDLLLLKCDSTGDPVWSRIWASGQNDGAVDLTLDTSGNIYVTGYGGAPNRAIILKYDSEGTLKKHIIMDPQPAYGHGRAIFTDQSDNIYAVAMNSNYGSSEYGQLVLLKYDSEGDLLYTKTWSSSYKQEVNDLVVDSAGNIYITGLSCSQEGCGNSKVFLVKYDPLGNQIWSESWGDFSANYAQGIMLDNSSKIYITGTILDENPIGRRTLLLKYNTTGDLLLSKTWQATRSVMSEKLALNSVGEIFITGYIAGATHNVTLLKYIVDTDGDGLSDNDENNLFPTDPNDPDTDGDGLSDYDEVHTYPTDPNDPDSDDDGYSDKQEIDRGTDPLDPSDPTRISGYPLSFIVGFILISLVFLIDRLNKRLRTSRQSTACGRI